MVIGLRATVLAAATILCGCAFSPPAPNDTVHEKDIMRSVLNELYCSILYLRGQDHDIANHPPANSG